MFYARITCTYANYTAVTSAIAEECWMYPTTNEDFHNIEVIIGYYDPIWEEQLPKFLAAIAANMPAIKKFEICKY